MTGWLEPDELRVGLGCMRLDERGADTIAAAVGAGITVFDTARSYDGNEELLARALESAERVRIVTKGGMSRPAGAWVPDGRARTIRADCEASLVALDGLPIDLYLLHTPDPGTPWRTSVRALARLVDEGLVARVGVCNVNRAQLDEALELAPISAAQVALSVVDDRALRGGLLDRCWLLDLAPNVVAIPGARRRETARSAARGASLRLQDRERERLGRPRPRARRAARRGDVVVVMGVPGAGKSRLAAQYVERGYVRLNRDERGGSLRGIAHALDEALADGAREVVLDNTYLTRALRSYVVEVSDRHGLPVRCIWIDTPLAQAQENLVERLVERFGGVPDPEELKAASRSAPGLLTPTQQMRAFRELEEPADDEGSVERVAFTPAPSTGETGVFVAAAAVAALPLEDVDPAAPHLVFDWRPAGVAADLDAAVSAAAVVVSGPVEGALCLHSGGAPI